MKWKTHIAGVFVLILIISFVSSCKDILLPLIEEDVSIAKSDLVQLTVVTGENGSTSPSGQVNIPKGFPYSISATAYSGYQFVNWKITGGDGVSFGNSTSANTTVTLATGDASILANFAVFQIGAVEFDPDPGIHTSAITVHLSTSIAGAEIRYTTDNTEPTESTGTVYNDAVGIPLSTPDATTIIQAKAFKSGMTPSDTSIGSFTITGTCADPVISPAATSPSNSFLVSLSTSTSGASIRYTTDNSTPTTTHGTLYNSAPFTISRTSTVRAIAYKANWLSSDVSSQQYTIGWARAYGHSSYSETAMGAAQSADGRYYIVSKSSASQTRRLTKIGLNGVLSWNRYYSQVALDLGSPIILTDDGGIVTCGGVYWDSNDFLYYTYLVKIDSNGTHSWTTKTYPVVPFGDKNRMYHESAVKVSDGSFAFSGHYWGESAAYDFILLSKAYTNGTFSGGYSYGGSPSYHTPGIDIIPSSGTTTGFILGGYYDSGTQGEDAFVIVTNLDGDIQDSWNFDGNANNDIDRIYSVKSVPSGGYICVGESDGVNLYQTSLDTVVIRIAANGTRLWHKYWGTVSDDDGFFDVEPTSDGGFILAGYTASYGAGGTDAWVMKLNSSGTIEWQKTYGGTSDDKAMDVLLTDDGGYLVSGETVSFGTGQNTWVIKLDSAGDPVYSSAGVQLGQNSTATVSQMTLNMTTKSYSKGTIVTNTSSVSNSVSSESWSTWTQYP